MYVATGHTWAQPLAWCSLQGVQMAWRAWTPAALATELPLLSHWLMLGWLSASSASASERLTKCLQARWNVLNQFSVQHYQLWNINLFFAKTVLFLVWYASKNIHKERLHKPAKLLFRSLSHTSMHQKAEGKGDLIECLKDKWETLFQGPTLQYPKARQQVNNLSSSSCRSTFCHQLDSLKPQGLWKLTHCCVNS